MAYVKTNGQNYSDIADAIRYKNGENTHYLPSEMATAIRAISGGTDQNKVTFGITNSHVSEFVTAARTAYAGNDNITIVANYKEAGTTPTCGSVSATGTVEVVYADGGNVDDSANGTYLIKHLSPNGGRISLIDNNDNTEWSKFVKPTGTVRFLDLNVTRNARDLGGWACDGGTVKYGMIYRMTAPNATDAGILLDRLKIRHQFDLRGQSASQNPNFPVPHYHKYSGYVQYTKKIGDGTYDSIVKQMIEDVIDAVVAKEPLLFNCDMGCDRTGTLAFYIEGVLGMSDTDIDIDYELSSLYDDGNPNTEYYYRYRTDNRVENETDWVGLKNLMSSYTGSTISDRIINYLISIGVSASRLNAFRAVMIDGNPSTIVAPTYTVTNTLTGCTTNNNATSVEVLQPYTAIITASTGYKLAGATVSITMGGTDITSSAYNNGVISIASVTGNLVITISAYAIPSYTNQIPISTDANGNVYEGTGYKDGYRLNSSGAETTKSGFVVTGYMPFTVGQQIWFDKFDGSEGSDGGLCFYGSDHTFIASIRTARLISEGVLTRGEVLDYTPPTSIYDGGTGTMKDISSAAYLRISVKSSAPASLSCGILGGEQTTTYTITNILSNCTTNNNSSTITNGGSYTATITTNSGYTLTGATVSVTMGGTDITSSAYINGSININSVSGNLVISVSAVRDTPVNLFDKNDTDVLLRGRINSSGAAVEYADGQLMTGYISASVGDTFEINTDKSLKTNNYTGTVGCYGSSKTYIGQMTNASSTVWTFSDSDMTGVCTIPQTLNNKDHSGTAYVRFCVAYTDIDNIMITKQ